MTDEAVNHFRIAYVFLWKKEMSAHSSILAWRIPWTEEPGGLQFIGSHRVGHNWNDPARTHVFLWPGILTVPPARRPLRISSVVSTGWRTGIILPEEGIHRRGANTRKSVCPWWRGVFPPHPCAESQFWCPGFIVSKKMVTHPRGHVRFKTYPGLITCILEFPLIFDFQKWVNIYSEDWRPLGSQLLFCFLAGGALWASNWWVTARRYRSLWV